MAEVVLINPSLLSRNLMYDRLEEVEGLRPPLAILSLGSYIENKGHSVKLIDVNPHSVIDSNAYLEEVEEAIEEKPLCVGLSVMTAQIPNAYYISQHIRKINPNIPIIWGGVHPTLYPSQTSEDPNVDFAVHGPGEDTLLELVQYLERGKSDFEEIKNIAHNGKVNPARKPLDANEIPFLDYDLLALNFYQKPSDSFLFQKDVRMLPMLTSRGCPYRCTFCINNTYRTSWRGLTPDRLLDELEFLINKYKLDAIRFLDENFFVNRRRTVEIIKGFQQRRINVQWGTNTRANFFRENHINTELAKELNKVGFTFASIGAESGSGRVLEFIKKDITVDDIINSAKICHEASIVPVYSWMIGIPTQTKEEMIENIEIIKKIKRICPSSIHYVFNIYRPFPGGELYELCKKEGLVEPQSLADWLKVDNLDLTRGSIPVRNCPWIKDKDFVIFIANYTEQIISKLTENKSAIDYLYSAFIKLRYRLRLFKWPNMEKRLVSRLGLYLIKLKKMQKSDEYAE